MALGAHLSLSLWLQALIDTLSQFWSTLLRLLWSWDPFRSRRNKDVYEYQALPANTSFRIFELLPGTRTADIRIRLYSVDWRHAPLYSALSYAWGNSNDCKAIYCEGGILEIPANLFDALKQLRSEHESRFLWADSICINQVDLSEKCHQVGGMRKIYQRAHSVIIWLGNDADGRAEEARRATVKLTLGCCKAKGISIDDLGGIDNFYRFTKDVSASTLDIELRGWHALEWLFKRPYFGRLWVFQEAMCGRRLEVLCGMTVLDWDIVGFAANYFCVMGPYVRNGFVYNGGFLQCRLTSTNAIGAAVLRNREIHRHPSALRVLHSGREFLATKAIDHIYAMLAFHAMDSLDIEVDYRKTRFEVFTEVARACIETSDSLEILAYVQHMNGVPQNMPSWVPVWDQTLFGLIVGFNEDGLWSAGTQVPAAFEFVFTASVRCLQVKGIIVDVVSEVLATDLPWPNLDRPLTICPLLTLWKGQPPGPAHSPEVWAATLCLHHRPVAGEPDCYADRIRRGRLFATYLRRCALYLGDAGVVAELRQYPDYLDWRTFETQAKEACDCRAIFTTQQGRIGRGPVCLEAGDVVCVLFGGSVPYLLRPNNGRYKLVGEVYVDDIMLGEAIDQWKAGSSLEERAFEIV